MFCMILKPFETSPFSLLYLKLTLLPSCFLMSSSYFFNCLHSLHCFSFLSVYIHVFIVLYSTYCHSYYVVNDYIIPFGDGVVLWNSY